MNKSLVALPILGLISFVASFWQTAEKIHALKNPEAALSCNINPIVDCGAVLGHPLSSVFGGVPNSMLGMTMFALFFGLAIVFMIRRTQPRILVLLLVGLASMAMGFSIWFFIVSLFVINKVCIFCVFIWMSTIPLFLLTIREFDTELFSGSKKLKRARGILRDRPLQYIVGAYILAVALFLYRFRDYYF